MASATLPVPSVKGPIPITASSTPFATASCRESNNFVDLGALGYVEEEFYVTGTAAVRGPSGEVLVADAPYTSRIVVRRPVDPASFSGTVHLEPFHVNAEYSPSWTDTCEYFTRHGDAWVGVTVNAGMTEPDAPSPRGGVALLKLFDPERYGILEYATAPMPETAPTEGGVPAPTMLAINGTIAQGRDIMAQVATLVKTNDVASPLAAYAVERVYGSGWSQTGMFWRGFIDNGHHGEARLADGSPVFDGYVVAVSTAPSTRPQDAVVVSLLSEAEVLGLAERGEQSDDDTDAPRFRVYEVPGTFHGWYLKGNDNTVAMVQLAARGIPTGIGHPEHPPTVHSDTTQYRMVHAVLHNLDRWVREGTPMPRGDRITRDPAAADGIARDEHGNALGGVRNAWVDVPRAQYIARCTCARTRGAMRPFSDDEMAGLYGGRDAYLARVSASVDEMVRGGWMLPADADLLKASPD